jgi:FRG domain
MPGTIGEEKLFTFLDGKPDPVEASCTTVRKGVGHRVNSFLELARKIAHLQYVNRNYALLFRGQSADHCNKQKNTSLKPSLLRPIDGHNPDAATLEMKFNRLRHAETELMQRYAAHFPKGDKRLKRERILRWSILQHYEVCDTPLLDVTHSLRIAASFASTGQSAEAFILVLGVPALAGAVSVSAEAGLQILRLASICPPAALRPHIQEGYLLGEYPDMPDYDQKQHYHHHEIDFGRRLVAKFRFKPASFWNDANFPAVSRSALYPSPGEDPLCRLAAEVKAAIA